jgi:serine phosphatase RsbU (regulator of sigma subunit)
MHLRALGLSLGILLTAPSVFGWTVDLEKSRLPITELAGPWRFHIGDDFTWSNQDFDDSSWPLIRADKGWSDQGYRGYHGPAWYRLEIQLPAKHGPLSLYIPNVDVSCQVFANGRLIGQKGSLPPRPHWVTQTRMVFPIPEDVASTGRMLLAVRVWNDAAVDDVVALHAYPGGLNPSPLVGDTQAIAQWRDLEGHDLYWRNSSTMIELFANLFSGLASLGLFALRRKEREYLWFSIYILAWAGYEALVLYSSIQSAPYYVTQSVQWLLFGVGLCTFIEFLAALLGQRRRRVYAGGLLFGALAVCMAAADTIQPGHGWRAGFALGLMGWHVCQIIMLYRASKAGKKEAIILLAAVAVVLSQDALYILNSIPFFSRLAWEQALLTFLTRGIQWPFPYFVPNLTGDLTNVAILVVLVRRYARIRQEDERLRNELAIAQEVQENLFPRQIRSLPTLELYGVCRPARTVSGDYYDFIIFHEQRQNEQSHNGTGDRRETGVGIAIGDISGKGISAALLMATLHSAVRAYCFAREERVFSGSPAAGLMAGRNETGVESDELFRSPGMVLALLNRHLYRSTQPEKYATLFLAHYDAATAMLKYSNAGQLPPLVLGRDNVVRRLDRGGTVIGLMDGMCYEEDCFQMASGDIMVAYSDGVTEPENDSAEFGEQRLMEVVARYRDQPLHVISKNVMLALDAWIGAEEQPDDITLVLARQV